MAAVASAERSAKFCCPRLDTATSSSIRPVRRRSRQGQATSGAALCHVCAGLDGLRVFQCRLWVLRLFAPSIRRFIAACSCMKPRASRGCIPGLVKPVGLMAANLPTVRERVLVRYPFLRSSAFERRMLFERRNERHSDVEKPRSRVGARFDRPAILNKAEPRATSSRRGSSLTACHTLAGRTARGLICACE